MEGRDEDQPVELAVRGEKGRNAAADAETDRDDPARLHPSHRRVIDQRSVGNESFRRRRAGRRRIAAIMKGYDVAIGKEFVQVHADVLPIPGVAAKAQNECWLLRRLVCSNVDSREAESICTLQRQTFRAGSYRPGAVHCMDWEYQRGLKFKHELKRSLRR